jgi:GT2 family glycosyltransferase
MKLTVIIVNYNVKHFLEQALHAAHAACAHTTAEVFVVDNVSTDGSVEMLQQPRFAWVKTIINTTNVGFAKANNQAMRLAQGEYILLLNPDTVVAEDTFEKVVSFMDANPEAGGLGVLMIDGNGNFLPESKRGLPTPEVAFYKIFGLSKIFPHSKKFGKYHLSYLDKNQTHEIQILSGAFMLMRKSVLDTIGLLDEKYFMYGEDIDLSYRITLAGYKNYYYPHTKIIHYKGESTKKDSLKYIITFYKAMVIFARQYFTKSNAAVFSYLINFAVVFRATIALLSNWLRLIFSPAFDAALMYGGMLILTHFWQNSIKNTVYPPFFVQAILPLYVGIWLVSVYFSGGYDKPFSTKKLVRGILFGTIIIAALYGFFNENVRFSRGIIVAGAAMAIFSMLAVRSLLQLLQAGNLNISAQQNADKNILAVGSSAELAQLLNILQQTQNTRRFLGFVSHNATDFAHPLFMGNDLIQAIKTFSPNEIIFCNGTLSNQKIIAYIADISAQNKRIDFKILPQNSQFIIGSQSVECAADIYTPHTHLKLNQAAARRNKRVIDVVFGGLLLVFYPLLWVAGRRGVALVDVFEVIMGKKTLIGYATAGTDTHNHLPKLKACVLPAVQLPPTNDLPQNTKQAITQRANLLYAKHYSAWGDVEKLLKVLFKRF